MKLSITLLLLFTLIFSCKKQDPCIDVDYFSREPLVPNMHMEWAGSVKIIGDSVSVNFLVEGKLIFSDTLINEEKVFDLLKWDDYTINSTVLDSVQSPEFKVFQKYQDCSNQD